MSTSTLLKSALLALMTFAATQATAATLPPTYRFTPKPDVDAVFAKWDSTTSPGCSLAVAQHGKLIYSRGYGMANLDHSVAITPLTPFHVASVSKQFTAASIVLLAQEGKLSLDDDVRKYLPEVPDFGTTITLRQLIHHTSGLRDQWDLLELAGWKYSKDLITDDDVLRLVSKQTKLNFPPNSRYTYSNTGYTLLALVVKKVSGQSLREFTTERIFKPLAMTNTHFRDEHMEIVPGFANGYVRDADSFRTNVTNFNTAGATSLLTTPEDLLKWDENFYTGQVGGRAFLEQMSERAVLNDGEKLDYATGIEHGKYRGLDTIGHTGSDAGYRAVVRRFPAQHFGIAIACNIAEAPSTKLAQDVADVFLAAELAPVPKEDQKPQRMIKLSAKVIQEKLGVYVDRANREVWRVVEKDGQLQAAFNDNPPLALTAQSESRFKLQGWPIIITFSGKGEQRQMTTQFESQKPQTLIITQDFAPTAADLEAYLGLFASEELDVRYRMIVKDGALHAASLRRNPFPLKPVTKDMFSSEQGMVEFKRAADGRVTGLTFGSDRAMNNEFKRIAE